ncbi:MAG: DUF1254 domain-containing protein [Beijerinckiaceae bacterium]
MQGIARRLGRLGGLLAAIVVLALISHILILFALPMVAATPPGVRLAGEAQANAIAPARETTAAAANMLFADPALETVACPFDLAYGPLRLRVPVGEGFMSIALVREDGRIPIAVTDRAATRRLLEMRVMTAQQKRRIEALESDDEVSAELRVVFPAQTGVAIIRALVPTSSEREQVRAQLALASCRAEPENEPQR